MKKRVYNIIFLIAAFVLSSCNDFLDTVPDNRTEIDSADKVAMLVAAAYPDGGYAVMFNARVDFVSDKGAGYTENTANTDSFFWRDVDDTAQDSPEYMWAHAYTAIASANHAIEAAEELNDPATDHYVAEAKLCRAFSHFLLVSSFSKMYEPGGANDSPGIPYVTWSETEVLAQYDRSTVAATYDLIEQDILEGIAGFVSSTVYDAPKYHFSLSTAYALAARFYLFKGEYDKVIEYTSKVVPTPKTYTGSTGALNVASTDDAVYYSSQYFQPWLTTYATASSSSDIKLWYTDGDNPANLLLTEMSCRMARYANTWRYACKQSDTQSTVDGSNASGATTWAYRVYSSSSIHYYVPKYNEHFVYTSINASTGYIYTIFPYFRHEELLLMRAEAYALTDDLDSAIADLNIFTRQRISSYSETNHVISLDKLTTFYASTIASASNFMSTYDAFGSSSWSDEKKAVVMYTLDCRRNEFMWEGLRYWDMWRYKIPITHMTSDGVTNTLYPGDDRWVLQIPETSTLSGMELNPRTNFLSPEW